MLTCSGSMSMIRRSAARMADAYLLDVTTPNNERRRELYFTEKGAQAAADMYARSRDAGWKTCIHPLIKIADALEREAVLVEALHRAEAKQS